MEVESCKIDHLFYCIWYENGTFLVEDMEAKKILPISNSQLVWFQEAISQLSQKPENEYLFKKEKFEKVVTKFSKFRAKKGWVMRCFVWPCKGGSPSFIFPQVKTSRFGIHLTNCQKDSRQNTNSSQIYHQVMSRRMRNRYKIKRL